MQDIYDCDGSKPAHKYQLRYAAGLYWLIDMEQSGTSYIKPVPLNKGGAQIWKLIESGMSEAEVCRSLCDEFGISDEQAQRDLNDFVSQLKAQNVDFGGTL